MTVKIKIDFYVYFVKDFIYINGNIIKDAFGLNKVITKVYPKRSIDLLLIILTKKL